MSIESIVLILGLVVLPLIQQMLQAKRQRDARAKAPPRRPVPEAPAVPDHAPFESTMDEALDEADESFDEMPEETFVETPDRPTERGAPLMPEAVTPAARALMVHRTVRKPPPVAGLRDRRDLRQAVVLTTILGRCRAVESYEPPERG